MCDHFACCSRFSRGEYLSSFTGPLRGDGGDGRGRRGRGDPANPESDTSAENWRKPGEITQIYSFCLENHGERGKRGQKGRAVCLQAALLLSFR